MKRIRLISLVVLAFLLISSDCGGPDILVINKVKEDGSVLRKLVITNDVDEFDLDYMQVPVDSTWTIEKSVEVSEEGDSLWTLNAQKFFASVGELNEAYDNYAGSNPNMVRSVIFEKKFRWFTTTYYFSETVNKAIDGYPPEEFFGKEYLNMFYMPEKIFNDFRYGPDSLKYKAMHDTLEERKEDWIGRSLIRDAIIELDSLQRKMGKDEVDIDQIWEIEKGLGEVILEMDEEEAIDSLLGDGFFEMNEFLIDSALTIVEADFNVAFEAVSYLIQTSMPGDLVGTNGYIDTDGAIIWEVDGDSILSKDYEMWAESTITNKWAWIVSGMFLIFVLVSVIIGVRKS